ncbi:MAG: AEC family transporter [Clostridia bacterium]|nr:AEC family transporter [Clostridia bacterium]
MNTGITSAVSQQVIIMAIYIIFGAILTKYKKLSQQGTRQMSFLLLHIVTPCVIISSFQGRSMDDMKELLTAFAISIMIHIIAIFVSWLFFLNKKKNSNWEVDRFCSAYSNCGFMGIPLLSAALGAEGVFFGSAYLVVFNIFTWTHGLGTFLGSNGKVSFKKVVFSPGIIGIAVSVIIILLNLNLGTTVTSIINGLAGLNTPVAMILLGIYLGESELFRVFKNINLYLVCFLRLILIPLVIIGIMYVANFDNTFSFSLVLSSACPCAALSAIFASEYGKDSGYASSVVSISTLLSLLTLPLMAYVASLVIK